MAYPKREVLIRFTVDYPNPDGTFHATAKSGGIYRYAREKDFEENSAEAYTQTFGTLMLMRKALEVQDALDGHILPPPFGHNCQWCATCVDQVRQLRWLALEKK